MREKGELPVVVGLTGASGAAIAVAVLKGLNRAQVPVALIVTEGGAMVLKEECGMAPEDLKGFVTSMHGEREFTAKVASGSTPTKGMVIVPCSANTLGKIAHGMADNLVARAAHVHLKEHRPLILIPRETPLSIFTLRNMTLLVEAGATMLVASPPYYLKASMVEELVNYMAGKTLDHLGVKHSLYRGWKSQEE